MKVRTSALVALTIIAASLVAIAAPASAGEGETATLTVIKTVEGTAPADAEFVINVLCIDEGPDGTIVELRTPAGDPDVVYDEDITFGPEGGEEDFIFGGPAVCTITETEDGGADEVINREIEIDIDDPTLFEAEITNVFAADVTTTAPAATTTAAVAAVAAPRFTG